MEKLCLYTDGGSRGNPGPAGVGIVLIDDKGTILKQEGRYLGEKTNNEAEYEALIWGMTQALSLKPQSLDCFLDSQLVVNQLNGFYRIKKAHLQPLATKIKSLEKLLGKVSYIYIPREENSIADNMVNEALDNQAA